MPFDAHTFATQELPTFTKMLGLEAVCAEASCSAPPLNMEQNFADMPNLEAVSIAAAAAEITGQGATSSYTPIAPNTGNYTP